MRLLWLVPALAALLLVVWLAGGFGFLLGERADVEPSSVARTAVGPGGMAPPTLVGRAPTSSTGMSGRGAIRGRVVQGGEGLVADVALRRVEGMPAAAPFYRATPHWLYEGLIGTGAPLASTRSAADGRFDFEGLVPGRYEVRARGAMGEEASRALDVSVGAARAEVLLALPSGPALLHGRARYVDGRPFLGFVRLHYDGAMVVNIDPFRTRVDWGTGFFRTGADGSFVLRGVPEGDVRLAALIVGERRYLSSPVTLPQAGRYEFVVDDGCEELTGEVTSLPGGEPVRHARIEIRGDRAPQGAVRRVVHTDAEGRFRVRIPLRHVHLQIDAPHHATRTFGTGRTDYANITWSDTSSSSYGWNAPEPLEIPPDRHLVVRLPRLARVQGVVRRADDGDAVAGAPVIAIATAGRTAGAVATATTDTQGRYDLPDAPLGQVVFVVAGQGWTSKDLAWAGSRGRSTTSRLDLAPGDHATLDLEVVPGVGLRGRVFDADGAPVAGASVRCLPSSVEPKAVDFPFGRFSSPAWVGAQTTDAEGRFAFDTLLPSYPYQVHVLHPEHPRYASLPHRAPDTGWEEVEVTLPATRGVDVRVVDVATGEGIAGAHVSLGNGFDTHGWTTDASGHVRVEPIDADAAWVWAKAPGYAGLQQAGKVAAAGREETEEVRIALARGVWVSGRVVAPEGVSPTDVHVSPALGGSWGARTGEDGTFRCGPVPAGPLGLRVYLRIQGRSITRKVPVTAPADDVVIDLRGETAEAMPPMPPLSSWSLEVVGPKGRPIPRARCRVWGTIGVSPDSSRLRVLNGSSSQVRRGRASLRLHQGGVPDAAWIAVWGAEAPAGEGPQPGAVSKVSVPPEGGAVRVELPAGRAIEGQMLWADGVPAAGATVRAFDARSPGSDRESWRDEQRVDPTLYRAHALAVCDAHGAFRLEGLGQGSYAIVPALPPDALAVDAPVVAAGSRDVRIVLRRGVAPTLTVLSPDGMPVAGCDVVVRFTEGASPRRVSQATTNGAGRARLPGLEGRGRYEVGVERPGHRKDLLPTSLVDWTPQDATVVLEEAFEVSGVVDTVLQPPRNALRVQYRIEGKDDARPFWRLVWARGDPPAFRIRDLRGEDVLRILVGNPKGKSDPRALRVEAGTTDLVLPPEQGR